MCRRAFLRNSSTLRLGVLDVPAHGQVGTVHLQHEAGLGHRLVLGLHRLGDRLQVGFLGRVVVVAEEERDHAGRGGRQEGALRLDRAERGFQILGVGVGGADVAHRDGAGAGGRLAPGAAGVAEHALRHAGELHEILILQGLAGAVEPAQAILHVGGVAGLAELPVVHDVDAGRDLLADHLGHRRPDARPRAAPSTGTPSSRANIMRMRSSGRGRLPVWVVRKRAVLRIIAGPSRVT